jgi:hypothetical protein
VSGSLAAAYGWVVALDAGPAHEHRDCAVRRGDVRPGGQLGGARAASGRCRGRLA